MDKWKRYAHTNAPRPCRVCGEMVKRKELKLNKNGSVRDRICKRCGRAEGRRYSKVRKNRRSYYKRIDIDSRPRECAICGGNNGGKVLSYDHDHVSGLFRGYLCGACNLGLGHFKDSAELLRMAIKYLE